MACDGIATDRDAVGQFARQSNAGLGGVDDHGRPRLDHTHTPATANPHGLEAFDVLALSPDVHDDAALLPLHGGEGDGFHRVIATGTRGEAYGGRTGVKWNFVHIENPCAGSMRGVVGCAAWFEVCKSAKKGFATQSHICAAMEYSNATIEHQRAKARRTSPPSVQSIAPSPGRHGAEWEHSTKPLLRLCEGPDRVRPTLALGESSPTFTARTLKTWLVGVMGGHEHASRRVLRSTAALSGRVGLGKRAARTRPARLRGGRVTPSHPKRITGWSGASGHRLGTHELVASRV